MEAGDSLWDRKDTDVMMQLTRLLEGGVIALTQRDAQLGAARLPRVFHALVPQVGGATVLPPYDAIHTRHIYTTYETIVTLSPCHAVSQIARSRFVARQVCVCVCVCVCVVTLQLAAAQDSVQQATSAALRHLIEACVTPDLVTAALTAVKAGGPAGRAAQPPLVSCIAAVAGSLSARYQDGWALAVPGTYTHTHTHCTVLLSYPSLSWCIFVLRVHTADIMSLGAECSVK